MEVRIPSGVLMMIFVFPFFFAFIFPFLLMVAIFLFLDRKVSLRKLSAGATRIGILVVFPLRRVTFFFWTTTTIPDEVLSGDGETVADGDGEAAEVLTGEAVGAFGDGEADVEAEGEAVGAFGDGDGEADAEAEAEEAGDGREEISGDGALLLSGVTDGVTSPVAGRSVSAGASVDGAVVGSSDSSGSVSERVVANTFRQTLFMLG